MVAAVMYGPPGPPAHLKKGKGAVSGPSSTDWMARSTVSSSGMYGIDLTQTVMNATAAMHAAATNSRGSRSRTVKGSASRSGS